MQNRLYHVVVFLLVIWLVFIVDAIIPAKLNDWGVYPWRPVGLIGIPLMPFLHAGLAHIFGNSISLAILLGLLVASQQSPWKVVAAIVVLNGLLLWAFGRSGNHIGASGLVFGLISFLILSGILDKNLVSIIVALVVGFLFGTTLIFGVIPRIGSEVSWDGHLFGAIGGGLVAYFASENKKLLAWK